MGTTNSSAETRGRAAWLAKRIGSYHLDLDIDGIVASFLALFEAVCGKRPVYKVYGGTEAENIALQNVQV